MFFQPAENNTLSLSLSYLDSALGGVVEGSGWKHPPADTAVSCVSTGSGDGSRSFRLSFPHARAAIPPPESKRHVLVFDVCLIQLGFCWPKKWKLRSVDRYYHLSLLWQSVFHLCVPGISIWKPKDYLPPGLYIYTECCCCLLCNGIVWKIVKKMERRGSFLTGYAAVVLLFVSGRTQRHSSSCLCPLLLFISFWAIKQITLEELLTANDALGADFVNREEMMRFLYFFRLFLVGFSFNWLIYRHFFFDDPSTGQSFLLFFWTPVFSHFHKTCIEERRFSFVCLYFYCHRRHYWHVVH